MNFLMKRPAASGVEPVPSKRSMKHGKSISEQVLSRSQKVPPASPNGNSVLCGGCARVRVQRRSADSVDSLGLLPLYQVSRKFLCENCHSAATALTELVKLPTDPRRIIHSLCSRTAGSDGIFVEDGTHHLVESVIIRRGCQAGFEHDARTKTLFTNIDRHSPAALRDGLSEALCFDVVRSMFTKGLQCDMRDFGYTYNRVALRTLQQQIKDREDNELQLFALLGGDPFLRVFALRALLMRKHLLSSAMAASQIPSGLWQHCDNSHTRIS